MNDIKVSDVKKYESNKLPTLKLTSLMAGIEYGSRWAIGKDKGLPWYCPDDMKFFRERTLGKTCIVSMKTLITIPNLLRGRTVIAITSDLSKYGYSLEYISNNLNWITVVPDKEKALETIVNRGETDAIVIGGSEIYNLFESEILVKIIAVLPEDMLKDTPTVFMDKPTGPPNYTTRYGRNLIHYY